ncbi:MAG: ImmA/IrrE family metallo-endopeptidase [Fimbriimonadaceae bacterium]|nr:MAG: ImmA/IrrE family metallo-endopeptidase [Fimbriimonadaceae bacterium]
MPAKLKPNYDEAKKIAKKVLEDNFVLEPAVPVFDIARNYVANIYLADFGDRDDVCGFIDFEDDSIVVNQDHSESRMAFTVAHELGHKLLHSEWLKEDPNRSIMLRRPLGGEIDPREQEANAFAAELLVPLKMLEKYRHLAISRLAQLFGVSEEVIGYRLKAIK